MLACLMLGVSLVCIGTLPICASERFADALSKRVIFRSSILRALPRAQGAQRTVRGCYVIAARPSRQLNAQLCVSHRDVELETRLAFLNCPMKFLAAQGPHGGLTNRELPLAAPHCLTPKARNVVCNRSKHLKVGFGSFCQPDCNRAGVVPGKSYILPSQLGEGVPLSCAGSSSTR